MYIHACAPTIDDPYRSISLMHRSMIHIYTIIARSHACSGRDEQWLRDVRTCKQTDVHQRRGRGRRRRTWYRGRRFRKRAFRGAQLNLASSGVGWEMQSTLICTFRHGHGPWPLALLFDSRRARGEGEAAARASFGRMNSTQWYLLESEGPARVGNTCSRIETGPPVRGALFYVLLAAINTFLLGPTTTVVYVQPCTVECISLSSL